MYFSLYCNPFRGTADEHFVGSARAFHSFCSVLKQANPKRTTPRPRHLRACRYWRRPPSVPTGRGHRQRSKRQAHSFWQRKSSRPGVSNLRKSAHFLAFLGISWHFLAFLGITRLSSPQTGTTLRPTFQVADFAEEDAGCPI